MATRLGIVETFQETLELCWKRLPALIRIHWAPALLSAIVIVALVLLIAIPIVRGMPPIPNGPDGNPDPDAVRRMTALVLARLGLQFYIPYYLVLLLAATMIGVPVSLLAAAGEEPEGFFFVRWSGRHTRFAIGIVLQVVLPYVVAIAVLVGIIMAGGFPHLAEAADLKGPPTPELLQEFLQSELVVAAVYLFLGILLMALTPMAAVENRLRLFHSISLGFGNFFPILATMILLGLALIAIAVAFWIVLVVANLLFVVILSALHGYLGQDGTAVIALVMIVVMYTAQFAFYVFLSGLHFAFPAIVYRRLSQQA